MALLRQCLQELRTKHHEWDAPVGSAMQAKVERPRRPESSLLLQGDRSHGGPAIASHRLPAA